MSDIEKTSELDSSKLVTDLFPFHFVLNKEMQIIGLGKSLLKLVPEEVKSRYFKECFKIIIPRRIHSFHDIQANASKIFMIKSLINKTITVLRGQMYMHDSLENIIFIGVPIAKDAEDITAMQLTFKDFALHDPSPDYLLALEALKISLKEATTMAERLNIEQENVLAANEELKKFAYIASHDLQAPLRSIVGFAQILDQEYGSELDKVAKTYTNYIVNSAKSMQQLINDLLLYARTQNMALEMKEVDLEKVLELVKHNLFASIKENNATLNITDLPKLKGNFSQLSQLFQNLIGNAIKFKKKDVLPVVTIQCIEQKKDWLISIVDNGIGITETYLNTVFEVFKRLPNARNYQGTGIGLSICQKIVERHEGKIWVESKINEGSAFFFTIKKGLPDRV